MSIPCQLFLLAYTLASPGTPARADKPAKAPRFSVRTVRGTTVQGAWRELKSDWSARVGEGDGARVAGASVLSVRRLDVPLPPLPMDYHLLLANGDRVPFRSRGLRLDEETIHFRHDNLAEGKEASLPLAAVSVLWRDAPEKVLDAEKLRRRLTVEKRTRDTVCLRNGDVVAGVLTGLDEQTVVVKVDKRQVTVKTPQVAYIAFNTELADTLRPKGVSARLVLLGDQPGRGGRMTLTAASADDTTLTGTTVFGARLRVPLRDIAALDLHSRSSVYLSDLKESKYVFHPFLDAAWPFAVDGNVAEHDFLLAGSTYDKGIGMHSHSRLSYRLSGAYRRFEALVGLDDKDGRRGAVRIRVLADGEPLLDRSLTSRDGAVPVGLSMEGVRELTLEVDFGRDGDVQDVVNWVEARLIK
ncbi:MAG TPA: NPCBM/NEW2 domain-containing protein [Gemmataceae bacterium]|nr:NPCBM/NEW2 domain-containing protein [Gemmataceae bacterium]